MDRLLRPQDIAAILGTSPGVAASILAEHGVNPVDFGAGRCRGRRWLESAVQQTVLEMHQTAQPKPKIPKVQRPKIPTTSLAAMSASELFHLTQGHRVQ